MKLLPFIPLLVTAATAFAQAPEPRANHTAVWTGTEMIIWGGRTSNGVLATGARFNPVTGVWTPLATLNSPTGRAMHTAVWTGSEMILFGGYNPATSEYFANGARYNPANNSWATIPSANAPTLRAHHAAVWSGAHMIVFAGATNHPVTLESYMYSGGMYSPVAKNWTATSLDAAPHARAGHTALWTAARMIVWGGLVDDYFFDPHKDNSGGQFDPVANAWTPTTLTGAPTNRTEHTAVWTGSRMIVWGGLGNGSLDYLNNGGRYDPLADAWQPTAASGAPSIRHLHTAVWTGTEMIVWGGRAAGNFRANGGRYNPGTDSWIATSTTGAPTARSGHTALWTGSQMLVWGGETSGGTFLNTLGRFTPAANIWGTSPTTSLITPVPVSRAAAGEPIDVEATATDPDGPIASVAFFANATALGTLTAPPYRRTWTNDTPGWFNLTAVATDTSGLAVTSEVAQVEFVLRPKLAVARQPAFYTLNATGLETGRTYYVQMSTNLAQWTTLSTNLSTNGIFSLDDPAPANVPARFYRALP